MVVIIDMCEEDVGIFLCRQRCLGDGVLTLVGLVQTIACSAYQYIALRTLNDRVDAWMSTICEMITLKVVVLIVVAHQSLGASYPEITLLVYQETGDGVVGDGG